MKKNSVFFALCLTQALVFNALAQEPPLEAPYSNSKVFKVNARYKNVRLGDVYFRLTVLNDRFDKKSKPYPKFSEPWENTAPVTLVFSDPLTGKTAYAQKFDPAICDFKKVSNGLDQPGKLYLRWANSSGGSGTRKRLNLVDFQGDSIRIVPIVRTSEIDFTFFNKNDSEVYVLRAIWNTKNGESHFSDHKYTVERYTYTPNGYERKILGTTKKTYANLDSDVKPIQILAQIAAKEKIMPAGFSSKNFLQY